MSTTESFVNESLHRLQQTGDVNYRKMFGGYGLFHNGLMFAIIADNELYLKADQHSVHFFNDAGLAAFSYSKANGKVYQMSYYQAPESFFDDNDETLLWTQRARQAALRAHPRKVPEQAAG